MTNEDAVRWLDNLKNDIGNPHYEGLWHYAQAIDEICYLLEEQEAKHGKWLESKILEDCFWVCSECEFPSEAFAAPMIYKYCPHCGAYMDNAEGR